MFQTLQHSIHQPLKRSRCADEAERHVDVLPMRRIAVGRMEGCLLFRTFGELNIVITLQNVECAKIFCSAEGI